jgi:DDE superfamily endonuclease
MMRYPQLARHPSVFRAATGLMVAEFDALLADVLPRLAAAERARRARPDRRRAIGGGRRPTLAPRDRVLLAVVWLRLYPTGEVLGYLFGVSEDTARRTHARLVPVLEAAGRAAMRLPDPGKGRRRPLDALLADTPELAVVVDTFEQRVQRPGDRAAADATYSGKKRQHTRKTQVVVDERDGRIVAAGPSARGPTADLTLLKASGLLGRLPPRVGAIADLAYVGIKGLHPAGLGATPRRKPRGKDRPPADVAYNRAFARRRVVVEHTIRRLRGHQALSQTDRHGQRGYDARVGAVAGLVNHALACRVAEPIRRPPAPALRLLPPRPAGGGGLPAAPGQPHRLAA